MSEPDKCNESVFYAQNKPVGNPVPPLPCGEEPQKLPKELVEKSGSKPTYTPALLPRPIKLYNVAMMVTCEEYVLDPVTGEPSEGTPITIAADKEQSQISIQSVAGIDSTVLTYIAKNNVEDTIEAKLKSRSLTVAELTRLTGMQPSQATTFLELARHIQTNLDKVVRAEAINALDCIWWNDARTATCATDKNMPGVASSNDHPDAVSEITIPAHTISSSLSKTAANDIAAAQAVAALVCFYVSEPVEVDCTSRPDAPEASTEWVPTDPEDVVPRRVGYAMLPAGAVISYVSVADATETAQQMALDQLNCFYKSQFISVECADPEARSINVDPQKEDKPIGLYLGEPGKYSLEDNYEWVQDPDARISAQKVIIPEGYFISSISTTDATNSAQQLADSLLACCYISDRIYIECPKDANKDYSPVWAYEVPRGAFVSCTSKQEANAQALASAEGIVDCVYCNDRVLPQCVPGWVTDAVVTGIYLDRDITMRGRIYPKGSVFRLYLPLDVDGLVNPFTGELEDISQWSVDATIGVAKDTVCSSSKREVEEIVQLLPSVVTEPKTGVPACQFKSTRLLAGCSFPDPYGNEPDRQFPAGQASSSILYEPSEVLYYATGRDGAYRVYKSKPTPSLSTKFSAPKPGTYIDIPEGMFMASAADVPGYEDIAAALSLDAAEQVVKQYLDELVLSLAKSMLECKYANPKVVASCTLELDTASSSSTRSGANDVRVGYNDPVATKNGGWTVGLNHLYNRNTNYFAPGTTDPKAPGGSNVVIEEGTIQGEIYQDVREQVVQLALSMLSCNYVNAEQSCQSLCASKSSGSGGSSTGGNNSGRSRAAGGTVDSAAPTVLLVNAGQKMSIPKGTVIATTHEEANEIAETILNCPAFDADEVCLYGNGKVVCTCDASGGTVTIPEAMFVGPDPSSLNATASAHCVAMCQFIDSEIVYYSAEAYLSCWSVQVGGSCAGVMLEDAFDSQVRNVHIEGSVEMAGYGTAETMYLPEGAAVSTESQEDADRMASQMLAVLCEGVAYTNAEAATVAAEVSFVQPLYYHDTGRTDTSAGRSMSVRVELGAGSAVADVPDEVCTSLLETGKAIIEALIAPVEFAATRYIAGGNKGCGEICDATFETKSPVPVIQEGTIYIPYANQAIVAPPTPETPPSPVAVLLAEENPPSGSETPSLADGPGVIKSIEASSAGYGITEGAIKVGYASEGYYGVIGSVQTTTATTALLANGVLTIPTGGGSGLESAMFDLTVTEPTIADKVLKIPYALVGGTETPSPVSILEEGYGVAPAAEPPSSTDHAGVIGGITVSSGSSPTIASGGIIQLPTADNGSPGLVSTVEASADTSWSIAKGTIKVGLAGGEAAGLIKKVEFSSDSSSVTPLIADGIITIPAVAGEKYTFDEVWLKTTQQTDATAVAFNEDKLTSAVQALAPNVKSLIDTSATAAIASWTDTSTETANGGNNGPAGTINITIETTDGAGNVTSVSTEGTN